MWTNFKKIFKRGRNPQKKSEGHANEDTGRPCSENLMYGMETTEPSKLENINTSAERSEKSLSFASTPPIPIPMSRKIIRKCSGGPEDKF